MPYNTVLLLLLLCGLMPAAPAAEVKVAAAADLIHALPVIAERFQALTGHKVLISFGSSGNLARQIEQGAPFEVFFSANEEFVLRLAHQGLLRDEGVVYALGLLALFVPQSSSLTPSADLSSLAEALANGQLRRLAIANPSHAPYGIAAREALQQVGLWERLQSLLVLGENAAQTAQLSASGNADAGLIPYAIAIAPTFAARGRFVLVTEELYSPLRQRMGLIKTPSDAAVALFAFIQEAAAKDILAQYGFRLP